MFLLLQLFFFVVVEIVVIILATGGARSLLLLVLKIEVLVLATGGAKSSTLRRTSMSRSSFPEKTQQPGKLIKKNTEKLLCYRIYTIFEKLGIIMVNSVFFIHFHMVL